jgi:benzoyl-CoA 2,3-epoxidase subunit B
MPNYSTATIRPTYHNAIVSWQERNFPELKMLEKYWDKYFTGQTQFQLVAKIGELKSDVIEHGRLKGKRKFERAGEMKGNMFYTARDIIKAQCSTELGSIQQHRQTLEKATHDAARFSVLRIMAEELRHAYQMFWVLDHDSSWKKPGHSDVAAETIEELLSMELGSHVLDAFNIDFNDFLDNVVYATVIDLVGKYQLDMQKVFSYAPVARSMGPMFSEEGFHLGSGRKLLKEISIAGVKGEGDYSISDVQRAINQWYPRGLEMFGNELGGHTNIEFGFKDKPNGIAQNEYIAEVRSVLDSINLSIVQTITDGIDAQRAKELIEEVQKEGASKAGISPELLLSLPSTKFFRKRGPEEVAFQPFSFNGELLTDKGTKLTPERYIGYLKSLLPEKFMQGREFLKYVDELREADARDSQS